MTVVALVPCIDMLFRRIPRTVRSCRKTMLVFHGVQLVRYAIVEADAAGPAQTEADVYVRAITRHAVFALTTFIALYTIGYLLDIWELAMSKLTSQSANSWYIANLCVIHSVVFVQGI